MRSFVTAAGMFCLGFGLLAAAPANAGNIFLTGHDADYHDNVRSASAAAAFAAEVAFVRNGSSLPVLTFDDTTTNGLGELTSDLTRLGVPFTNVNPNDAAAVAVAMSSLSTSMFSAIAVASNVNCGGCDNTNADLGTLATHVSQFAGFLTAGGGILGFAGASDPTAYDYVPAAAGISAGSPPPNGFVETAAGTANGLLAENGDETHNYFSTPGTGGVDPAYVVAEVNGDNVESLFFSGAAICTDPTTCRLDPTPLPAALPLFASGLGALGLLGWRRKRKAPTSIL